MRLGKICKRRCRCRTLPFFRPHAAKRRPALVIADLEGDDVILCQITSQAISDRYAVSITDRDFSTGGLKQQGNVRPNRIFTADSHIILYKIGALQATKIDEIIDKMVGIIRA